MLFKVDARIFEQYPDLMLGIVVAHNIDNHGDTSSVNNLLQVEIDNIKKQLILDDLEKHPHIVGWREVYKKMGANPKKHLSSIENLLQRILQNKPLGHINTLVDLYNTVSLKYLVPAGGEDLATIEGNFELAIAGTNEAAVTLLGDSTPRTPDAGEIFYKDANGAVCRRWNWKEADRTKLTPNTTHAILFFEALTQDQHPFVQAATNKLAHLIEQYCGGHATIAFVTNSTPPLALKDGNNFVALQSKQAVNETLKPLYKHHQVVEQETSEEHFLRVEKVKNLQAHHIDPWPAYKPVAHTTQQALDYFKQNPEAVTTHSLAGRLLIKRDHGKTFFGVLQDRDGRIQIYIKKDDLGEEKFEFFKKNVDIGDIIWTQGVMFVTKMGEITLKVEDLALISKCLHPLPEKFHGLTDVEQRYRQRYLDLICNQESKEKFKKRSLILQEVRHFLQNNDFLEVETPMLHPIPGGAAARPFVTHHNAYNMELYLRIAPELYLKRLVIGGFERVFEINRNFRNEGISTRHNPEFTMLEFYMAHGDYKTGMDLTEGLIATIMQKNLGTLNVTFNHKIIDFTAPFKKLTVEQSLIEIGKLTPTQLTQKNIDLLIQQHNIELHKNAGHGVKLFALFELLVEPHIVQPTFIIGYPIEVSPLAKRDPNNPEIAARFELFVCGMEIANGFTELNDPFDQAERFKAQAQAREGGNAEAHYYDADYIKALEYGLAPTVGVGIGIDRLVMLATNTQSIKDVILFPTLKIHKDR